MVFTTYYTKYDLRNISIENIWSVEIRYKEHSYTFTFENNRVGVGTVRVNVRYLRKSFYSFGHSLLNVLEEDMPRIKEWN